MREQSTFLVIGKEELGREDGAEIIVGNEYSRLNPQFWGRSITPARGEIKILDGSAAAIALSNLRNEAMREAGRTDGNYINVSIMHEGKYYVVTQESWHYNFDNKVTTYKLY